MEQGAAGSDWPGSRVAGFCQMVVVRMGILLGWLTSEKRPQEWAWRLDWLPPAPHPNTRIHDGHCWAKRLEKRVWPETGGLCISGRTMSIFFCRWGFPNRWMMWSELEFRKISCVVIHSRANNLWETNSYEKNLLVGNLFTGFTLIRICCLSL